MKQPPQSGTELIDQAILWIERCREREADSEELFDWITESPRHVEVFVQALTLEQRIVGIPAEHWRGMAAGDDEADRGGAHQSNVVPLAIDQPTEPRELPVSRGWRLGLAAVAAGLAVAVGALMWREHLAPQEFVTAIGEQRIVQLQDGSVVNLNTDSRLRVRITAQTRELELLGGEALFKVQQDSARPFRVSTRDTVIQAVGTQFNVYSRASGTTVSVLEGRVRVPVEGGDTPGLLSAGERVEISSDGTVGRREPLNAAQATAWQQRRLVFDEETLSNIIAEFNRYNHRQLGVQDATAAGRRFSGVFDADDPESLAQLLSRDASLAVERRRGAITIRSR